MATPEEELLAGLGLDLSTLGTTAVEAPEFVGGTPPPAANFGGQDAQVRATSGYGQFSGYLVGAETALLQSMAPEVLIRLQDTMVALGLTSKVVPGELDNGTISGFTQILSMANRRGERWQSTLSRATQTAAQTGSLPGLSDTPLLPDYATVSRQVKSYFKDQLGRDPTQAELRLFGDQMMSDAAAAVSADAPQADLSGVTGAGRDVAVEPGHEIDAVARFQEAFDAKYAPTIQSLDEQTGTQQGAALARANITAVADAAGA